MNTVYAAADAKKITALVHWLGSTSRRPSTPSTTMCLPAVFSHSSVLLALPPAGYGRIGAPVSSSFCLADTRLL